MPQAIILPSAEADLAGIWEYIAQDSPENADRFVDGIYRTCNEILAYNPRVGRSREELAPGLCSFPHRDYVIFYRPVSNGVDVVRVLHGHRDIEAIFAP